MKFNIPIPLCLLTPQLQAQLKPDNLNSPPIAWKSVWTNDFNKIRPLLEWNENSAEPAGEPLRFGHAENFTQ